MVKEEFHWYLSNQNELVKKYNGKVLVIKDNQVVGTFSNDEEAYFDSVSKYELGTFMIQKCTEGVEAYTQQFSSRVVFV
jgi:hypothetical protein